MPQQSSLAARATYYAAYVIDLDGYKLEAVYQ